LAPISSLILPKVFLEVVRLNFCSAVVARKLKSYVVSNIEKYYPSMLDKEKYVPVTWHPIGAT
jgi:hypothetical protein